MQLLSNYDLFINVNTFRRLISACPVWCENCLWIILQNCFPIFKSKMTLSFDVIHPVVGLWPAKTSSLDVDYLKYCHYYSTSMLTLKRFWRWEFNGWDIWTRVQDPSHSNDERLNWLGVLVATSQGHTPIRFL